METTIQILHKIRNSYDKRIKYFKVTSFVLAGLLLIDFIIYLFVQAEFWGMLGAFISFMWAGLTFVVMLENKTNQAIIDEFYLEVAKEKENENEVKTESQ